MITANLFGLYWMISMQLLRNLHLAWRVLYASISTILCCEVFASLCYKGKVTPAKVRRHESRQELIDVLKPHAIRVGKALLATFFFREWQ